MSYAENMITFRAMFGRNMPDGLEVSDAAMTNYLKAVDRVFDCYTVTDTVEFDQEAVFITKTHTSGWFV